MDQQQLKTSILKDLNELGKMCKDAILDLDTDKNHPLKVQYIKIDTDIFWKCDNTRAEDTTRKFIIFAYETIKSLLHNRYKSDNLSISYKDKHLKLVYSVNGLNITTVL